MTAATAEITQASQAQSEAVARLRQELRSEFTAAMARAEELVAKQSAENAETLDRSREAVDAAVAALNATEQRVLASFERLVKTMEQGMASRRPVDLSRESIAALAEASRNQRRFWPFGKRR
jgi:hypothetical protein